VALAARGALVVLAVLLSVAGCGDDDGAARVPLDPGGCGLPAYAWLPARDTGAALDWEEDILSPMPAGGVDTLLAEYTDAFSPVPYGARVFRLRYTTQDRGQPVEATALVGLPWAPDQGAEKRPIAVWTHGTTGFMGKCAPSFTGEGDIFGVYLLASLGYVVAAPDYIGLDAGADFSAPPPVRHAYLNIEQTAIGTLDSVRAAVALLGGPGSVPAPAEPVDTPVTPDTDQVVLWGGSQGGHAALAADLLAPYYAPNLGVRATVAMVPPTDLLGLADYAVSAPNPATLAVAAMLVANHYFYEGEEPFDALLSSSAPLDVAGRLPEALYDGCDAGDVVDDATRLEQVFATDLLTRVQADGWDAASPWSCYLRENSFGTTSIERLRDTPTLVVLSEDDDLVYTPVIREDFDRLCDQGYRLEYLECADAGHAEGAGWSLPEQVAWVQARLAGEPIDPVRLCQRQPAQRCSGQPQ
jgi:hypothetical protein